MTRWTDEQLNAIAARGSSVLLSAAAGSGKTTVLVERVLRLVADEGADVDRMLVVTFTRAAASDMRAKLSRKLSERAAAGDARCREQLLRLDRASISTLHAFCADFLRSNFESAGIDPAFRILDDALVERLRQEALDEALEDAYAHADEAMLALDYGRGPAGVRAAVDALMRRMEERPDPEAWLDRACQCDEVALTAWQDELKDAARRAIGAAIVQLWEALSVPNCPPNYENAIRADIRALQALQDAGDYDELYRGVTEFKAASARSGGTRGADPDAVEAVKRLRASVKRSLDGARIAQLPLLTAREDAQKLSGQLRTLADIAVKASQIYAGRKAEQAGLTYADLEHRTLEALRDPAVSRQMREKYDYVFVDEYQDTSDLQEALVCAVSRPDNVFMVGDVKQSIYRFRMAEPGLFLEKYAAYAAGEGGRLLPLTRNFRSRRGILDFVNMVFERAMTGGDSEIVYDINARLNPGDPDAPAPQTPDVEICLLDSDAEPEAVDEADEAIEELKDVEREALWIAQRIRQMMGEDPALKYRDFAILTRNKTTTFSAMLPVLLACGIPAYADGAAGYFESLEIMWTLSMLRLIANPRLDIELIAVLHSPAVALDADALARIRIADPDLPYCDAAAHYAESHDDAIAEALRDFFEQCALWRLKCGSISLGEFVRMVLDESGFYAYAGALPGGAQRQANLDQFVASADAFDSDQSGSLTRFLQYTEHLKLKGDGDAAHLLSENDNVVRMMTIHKSKGLEFKVVFGAQLARRYRVERRSAPLVAHRDLGMGMSYVDPELRTRRQTLPQAAIIERERREDAAEELRILYVLLTRAKDHLALVGTVRRADAAMQRWRAIAQVPFAAQSHLDAVMAARCAAEADGAELHSTLTILPAEALRLEAIQARETGAEAWRRILSDAESHKDPALEDELRWHYPEPEGAKRPMKLTASGLVRELEGPEEVPALTERPQFMAEDARGMTGAERGTACHRAMQLLDLRALDGLSGAALTRAVADQLDGFVARRLMTAAQREVVSPNRVARFLSGAVGLRLREAQTVHREWAFNAMLPTTGLLTPEEAARFGTPPALRATSPFRGGDGGNLLVQGTIDCCFIEDGAWVLLDYKTDRADDLDALRARYQMQLKLYALALERVTGMPVKQRLLCLIAQGVEVEA